MKDNDNDKDVFNLIMFILIGIVSIIILATVFISTYNEKVYNEKVYDSCKITGVYYIDQDRSIKCEVIKK